MSATKRAAKPAAVDGESEVEANRMALKRIWQATATALEAAVKTPGENAVPAATLQVARQFLSDNGIDIEAMRHDALTKRTTGLDLPYPTFSNGTPNPSPGSDYE